MRQAWLLLAAAGLGLTSALASMTDFSPSGEVPDPVLKRTPGKCRVLREIAYREDVKGCVLDLLVPEGVTNFPVVVWFHGGGLTSGKREFVALDTNRVAVAAVEYRLLSHANGGPATCLDDAAASVAWVKRHIADYGGDPQRVFVGGHSAGGYLTFMLGLDARWLGKYGLTPFDCAGYLPLSGQVTKHYNVRKYFGVKREAFQPIIDEWAPLNYLAAKTPPFCVALGDPGHDWPMRVEENWFMYACLRKMGNKDFDFHSFPGKGHGSCRFPALGWFQKFIDEH